MVMVMVMCIEWRILEMLSFNLSHLCINIHTNSWYSLVRITTL
jgi:hypothetical protein